MTRDRKMVALAGLMAGVSMTAMEQRAGRFMRAPDHPSGDGFEGSGAWSEPAADANAPAGGAGETGTDDNGSANSVDNSGADDDAGGDDDASGDDQSGDDDGHEGEEDDEKKPEKPRKPASDRIRELNRRLRESERERDRERGAWEARLAALENRGQGSTNGNGADNSNPAPEKPNPNDLEKYPLGSLDDRYIEDMIDYAAEKKASAAVDGLLQRQEQTAQQQAQAQALADLRTKADTVAAKGSELHDDYEETVVAAGLRGDYKLTQVTFEAAAEAEHGEKILYALAKDKAEAARVAALSPFQQLKYVADKNAEIAGKAPPPARKIPGRDQAPPANQPRGGASRTEIRGDTDDLDAFEKRFYSKKN